MRNSEYAFEFKQAQELLASMEQMLNYAKEPEFIDASIHFIAGCQMLINAYIRLEKKGEIEVPEITAFVPGGVNKTERLVSSALNNPVVKELNNWVEGFITLGGEVIDLTKKLYVGKKKA